MEDTIDKMNPLFQRQNVSEELIKMIKKQILAGDLNPGDRIIESKLARQTGLSQSPIREALRQMQGEGIIKIVPNKGPSVVALEMKDIFEVYSIRSMLEGLAMRMAVHHATDEEIEDLERFYHSMEAKLHDDSVEYLLEESLQIHETIIRLSNHSRLHKMYQSITFQVALVNRMLGVRSSKAQEVEEHEELIVALKKRDPDEAEHIMRKHIYRSYCHFVERHGQKSEMDTFGEKMWYE
ncbi:GntR family transcriptional regulator [Paenibacillus hodogayensis]|uniref:GntR family transcriptional regulator n=1 Tax=Paenibacillus hodogayensis TaxID=279208 RepID=A0ABV5W6G3_9BACL